MGQNIFLMPLASSFIISLLGLGFFVFVSKKKTLKNLRQGARHIHQKGISRLGGVAIIIAFIATVLLDKRLIIETPLLAVLFASGAILIFGVIDDFVEFDWKVQMIFQILIFVAVFAFGVRLQYMTNPFGEIFLFSGLTGTAVGFLISAGWVVLLMNSMNWVDGIDGVSGGISLIGVITIFLLSLRPEVNQPPVGILASILAGAFLAFLIFNFNPAKIIAGTSGSIFMGFILGVLAIFAGAKIATTLLVLAVPIIDALWVILERLRAKQSVFSPDRRHLHYRLLELGWSQGAICSLYWGITAAIAFIALNTDAMGKIWSFSLVAIAMLFFLFSIKNKLAEKNAE